MSFNWNYMQNYGSFSVFLTDCISEEATIRPEFAETFKVLLDTK